MIPGPYTLFTRVPVFIGPDGGVFTDALWCKDLELHLGYIDGFRLCCPAAPLPPGGAGDLVRVRGLAGRDVTALRQDLGWGSVLRNLVPNFLRVARAVRGTRVVHSGGAGWAFPLSFYILALRPVLRRKWVVVIESSFWMKPVNRRATPRRWISHHLHAVLLRACLRRADARIFTQDGYRRFFGIGNEATLVAPAVWVDAAQVLSDARQEERVAALPPEPLSLLFPARLVPEKGVDVVLAAVGHAEASLRRGPGSALGRVALDIVGDGPLAARCRAFAAEHDGPVRVRFLAPVAYGEPFFALLRGYHAILLANRHQEQPRVIFDAFSQGVGVISSDTAGVREIVTGGQSALLFEVDDAEGLARQILRLAEDRTLRATLMANGLRAARAHSHAGMHETRARFLEPILG